MKRIIPLLILIGGSTAWWWFQVNQPPRARYSGTIEAYDASLGSKVGGRIIAVEVKEGDMVKTGAALVRLERDSFETQLRMVEADLERARQRQLELEHGTRPQDLKRAEAQYEASRQQWLLQKNGPRAEDIRAARANVEAAKADLNLASITQKRQHELFEKRNTAAENLDRAEKEYIVAQNRLHAAEAELDRLLAGFRPEEIQAAYAQMAAASAALDLTREGTRTEQIAQARADTRRAEAAVEKAAIDLRETVITAPADGVIETCRLEPGDLLSPNQVALTMILYKPIWVRIFVPESQLGRFPIHQELSNTVASFPQKTFKGQIVQVNRRAEFTPRNVQTPETRDDLVFGVKIEIDDPEHLLRAGMVADVHEPEARP